MMFSYYGSKSKIVHLYPSPKSNKIIEPFAGSARYSLKYFENDVFLVDKYKVVVDVWHYLQRASEKDIMGLPTLRKGENIKTLNLSDEEKLFLSMNASVAGYCPRWTVSMYAGEQNGRGNQLKRFAKNLYKIRHWNIVCGDWRDIENQNATWFIDPPYQVGGDRYIHSDVDYSSLAQWSKERNGQVIVCENTKADWMDFWPMAKMRGAMSTTTEAIWSNMPHDYMARQAALL